MLISPRAITARTAARLGFPLHKSVPRVDRRPLSVGGKLWFVDLPGRDPGGSADRSARGSGHHGPPCEPRRFHPAGIDWPEQSATVRPGARGCGPIEVLGQEASQLEIGIGVMPNTDGGVFGYGGVYIDVAWGDALITPLVGLGGDAEGGSKDLGGVFQFLASGTVAYAFPNGSRLGIRLSHLSNASIHHNPGVEDLMLIYSLPFH